MSEEKKEASFRDKLYGLDIGQCICPNGNAAYIRVPGGWVYQGVGGVCFIPFPRDINND